MKGLFSFILASAVSVAYSGEFFAVDWSGTSGAEPTTSLYRIDDGTGAVTTLGDTGLTKVNSMSYDMVGSLVVFAEGGKAYELDKTTGSASFVSSFTGTGWTGDVRGFAVGALGKWYVIQDSAGSDKLFTLDPTLGTAAEVGTITGHGSVQGLTFGSDGTLWAYDVLTHGLFSIDPSTGTPTDLTSGPVVLGSQTLFFSGGRLLGAAGSALYEFDLSTGAGTLLYSGVAQPDIRGAEAVPEPATIIALGVGVFAVARARLFRTKR